MSKELKTIKTEEIKFYDDVLLGGKDEEGNIWLAVNQTCKSLGFDSNDSKNQARKITQDKVLKKMSAKFYTDVNYGDDSTQGREIIFISEKAITLWLAKISITNKMEEKYPNLSDKLIKYQLECAEVLHKHFMGNEDSKDKFFKDMFDINLKELIEQNKYLTSKIEYLDNKLENQNQKIYLLLKRFDIYENENTNYTRLVDDFSAKTQGVINDRNKHYIFWEAICNWFGISFNLLKSQSNKKKWILDNIGINKLNYFIDNVILDRIIQNDKGNWINLQGFNSDPFNVEKNKILKYWTDSNNNLRCCYCGKVINNPKENVNYNYEHLIAKTQSNTSNTLNNLAISCCECNKEKYSNNYKEFQEKKNTKEYLVDRLDKWMLKYNYKEK